MAYDNLSDTALARDLLAKANELENGAQAVMRATTGTAREKANLLENKSQQVMRRAAELADRLEETPAPPAPPALEGVLIMGQSHSVDYRGYWSGAIRFDNPGVKWLQDFNAAGAGITRFEEWLPQLIERRPAVVIVSCIPEDLIGALDRYEALFAAIRKTGAKVIANNPWATRYTTPEQRRITIKNADSVADFASHVVMGKQGADDDAVLYRDEIHWTELSGKGGHDYAYAIWSRAVASVVPVKIIPEPSEVSVPTPGEPTGGWVPKIEPIIFFSPAEVQARLRPSWGNGEVAPDTGVQGTGDFRLGNRPSWAGLRDPFFRPGQARAGHHHMGYGNIFLNENSTYPTMREQGYCVGDGAELDRGGFWVPTPFFRDKRTGQWQYPRDIFQIRYYKGEPDIELWDELSQRSPGFKAWVDSLHPQNRAWYEHHRLVEIPAGLRFISGVTNGSNLITLHKDAGRGQSFSEKLIADLVPRMQVGDLVSLNVHSSVLWDGKNIDSPDHASHMANETRDDNWRLVIDPDFPVRTPVISQKYQFYLQDWMDFETFALSSDLQTGSQPGSTMHAEYVEGWEPEAKRLWHTHAVNEHRNCSGGDLGNGFQLTQGPDFSLQEKLIRFPDEVPFI